MIEIVEREAERPEAGSAPLVERYFTYRQAARELNLPYHVIQQAAKRGAFPTYRLNKKRRYVRVKDINCAMTQTTAD